MSKTLAGVTLLELLIAIFLLAVILGTLTSGYVFIYGKVLENIRLQNIHLQIDYALENIKLRCLSASRIEPDSLFLPGIENSKNSFSFSGESDFHRITPDNTTDNTRYTYRINEDHCLVLEISDPPQKEVLVDNQSSPTIAFQYSEGAEPNFLTVTINATTREHNLSKTEGLRFWFTDVLKIH